jgi:hypothetical protein
MRELGTKGLGKDQAGGGRRFMPNKVKSATTDPNVYHNQ